jgi:hypothetical protein
LPLFEKVRIEVFLPEAPDRSYEELREVLEDEFTYTFGGCSVIDGVRGYYLSSKGSVVQDRVNSLFTDMGLTLDKMHAVQTYVERLKFVVSAALPEESILIAVHGVFHG